MSEQSKPRPNHRLKRERERRSWSQEQLAHVIGTTSVNVSRWERGVSIPGPHYRRKLCDLFDLTPQELGFLHEALGTDAVQHVRELVREDQSAVMRRESYSAPLDHVLLPVPDRLIGRTSDLAWLVERLRHGGVVGITALSGLGGIGKTTLAAVAIRILHQEGHFPDGIAVVVCQDIMQPDEVLRRVMGRFNLERSLSPDGSSAVELREAVYQHLCGKRALVVLDNIEPGWTVEDAIHPLREAGVTLLLTARHALPRSAVTYADTRSLDLLSREEAIELFWYTCGRSLKAVTRVEQHDAERIVNALDRHTLAVKLAGTYAADVRHDLQKLAEELTADPLDLPEGETPRAVARVFARSCATLPPEASELFTGLAAVATAESGRQAALALGAGLHLEAPKVALDTLVLRALVQPFVVDAMPSASDRERIRLHPLLLAFAREQFARWPEAKRDAARRALARHYAAYVQEPATGDVARGNDEDNLCGSLAWAIERGFNEETLALCEGMGVFWRDRWRFTASLQLLPYGVRAGEAIAQHTGRVEDVLRASRLALLHGQILLRFGRPEDANRVLRRLSDVSHGLHNPSFSALALFSLGQMLLVEGRVGEAEQCLQQSLQAQCEMPIQDWQSQAEDMRYLVQVAWRQDAVAVLMRYHREALDIAHLCQNRLLEAANAFSLGQIALLSGQRGDARQHFLHALTLLREVGARFGLGVVLMSLARTEVAAGRLDEAEHYIDEGLPILLEVKDTGNAAWMVSMQGQIAHARGALAQAAAQFEKALATHRAVKNPRGESETLRLLGQVALDRGETETAEQFFRQSLAAAHEARGVMETAHATLALAQLLFDQQKGHAERRSLASLGLANLQQAAFGDDEVIRELHFLQSV